MKELDGWNCQGWNLEAARVTATPAAERELIVNT